MTIDGYARCEIAERIAAIENRIAKLRHRVNRLQQEGSDARRDREILGSLIGNLGDLYNRQSNMRRAGWTVSR